MKNKIIAALAAVIVLICGTSAYANSDNAPKEDYSGYSALDKITATASPTSTAATTKPTSTAKPSRTISSDGTGHVVDNVTNSDDLQFISVTAKDGSVFYVVIDKKNSNDNVYFLNKVDIADLEALAKDSNANLQLKATPTPSPTATPEPDGQKNTTTEKKQEKAPVSSTMLVLILAALAAAVIGGYYFKVIIPKKKLEQADDLEDFDFEDDDSEEVESEDYSEDKEHSEE